MSIHKLTQGNNMSQRRKVVGAGIIFALLSVSSLSAASIKGFTDPLSKTQKSKTYEIEDLAYLNTKNTMALKRALERSMKKYDALETKYNQLKTSIDSITRKIAPTPKKNKKTIRLDRSIFE